MMGGNKRKKFDVFSLKKCRESRRIEAESAASFLALTCSFVSEKSLTKQRETLMARVKDRKRKSKADEMKSTREEDLKRRRNINTL
jgi:hypothetical protein